MRAPFFARVVMENGGYFSIENPWDSRIWEMPFMKSLLKLKRCEAGAMGRLHDRLVAQDVDGVPDECAVDCGPALRQEDEATCPCSLGGQSHRLLARRGP